MQINLPSLLLLKKLANQRQAGSAQANNTTQTSHVESGRQRLQNWLTFEPEPIKLYSGETEIFRKGLVLVTDTRLAYIDPFDRVLKTYMFEHMVSVHKQFYRSTDANRRLCKGLVIISLLALLVLVIIDLMHSSTRGIFLVYLPLIASTLIGLKVWNDMKPRYVIHWRMRDMTYGEIAQEPLFRERLEKIDKREQFMNELADAMNQALSGKAQRVMAPVAMQTPSVNPTEVSTATCKPALSLVTDSYE